MPQCLICNRGLRDTLTLGKIMSFQPRSESYICDRCSSLFHQIPKKLACPGCSRLQENESDCQDCIKWKGAVVDHLVAHEAFFCYEGVLKQWLQVYKFQGDTRYAYIMSDTIRKFYQKHADSIIVPIPCSEASLNIRGFNQCEELLKCAGVPYINLVMNISKDKKQSEKNRSERMQTGQPFQINKSLADNSRSVLLFDDVYTTGRTVMHAKELLLEAGYSTISSFSIGR